MGRLHLHLHGRLKDAALKSLSQTYQNRLQSTGLSVHTHTEEISKYLSKLESLNGQLFLLDERGQTFTSIDFAEKVQSWSLLSTDTHIAIGPAEGWQNLGPHLPRILSLIHI